MNQMTPSPDSTERPSLSRRDVLKLSAMALLFAACRPRGDVPQPIQPLAGGFYFSLAIRDGGRVWAWGENRYGVLGDGARTDRATPVRVPGLDGVIGVSAGGGHGMALKQDGTVWAWGANGEGQIGDGTTTDRPSPVQVSGLAGIVSISARSACSAALRDDGTVWVWGGDYFGRLGGEARGFQPSPVQVPGLPRITAITVDMPGLALDSIGGVWDWDGTLQVLARRLESPGSNTEMTDVWGYVPPAQVPGLPRIVAIDSGSYLGVALDDTGTVWTWGNNFFGQLGVGAPSPVGTIVPAQVVNLTNVVAISGGESHVLALVDDGSVWGWGSNSPGHLGDGTIADRPAPVQVHGLSDIVAISAGFNHSLAVQSDGTVWAWGYNLRGQLGDGTLRERDEPVRVVGLW